MFELPYKESHITGNGAVTGMFMISDKTIEFK